jgi:hypothetical protein
MSAVQVTSEMLSGMITEVNIICESSGMVFIITGASSAFENLLQNTVNNWLHGI